MVYTRFDSDDEEQYSVTPVVDEYTYDVPGRVIWPAWTIGDLIDLLPDEINITDEQGDYRYTLEIGKKDVTLAKEYAEHKNLIDNLVDAVIGLCGNKNKKNEDYY